jgi:acyl-coenzyme A synthetase/AMP-(fatty) acid ligase
MPFMTTPQELENILITHHMVKEVCVLTAPRCDKVYKFHAFLVPVNISPTSVFECQVECQELVEGYAVRIEMLPDLPKSRMGRVSRDTLRSMFCSVDALVAN